MPQLIRKDGGKIDHLQGLFLPRAVPAQAATINLSSGLVTGIDDLDVGGSLYDIAFIGSGTSYNTAYGGANIAYANASAIVDAIKALLNAEYPNVPNIAGTSPLPGFRASGFAIPYSVAASTVDLLFASRPTASLGFGLYGNPLTAPGTFRTGTLNSPYSWIVATPAAPAVAETPIPGALPLFATGLTGLGFVVFRRRQAAGRAGPKA
jgi:hypothetical protein